jgi:endonuclease/exonuclease/phosphatase family metal-dependent hydrolase
VYVVSVHFVHDGTNATATRIAQMQELVANITNYENIIIGGDLNTTDLTELATLQNAGFTFGNGGAFGTVNSFSVSNPAYPLDNVGVRGSKLKLRSFEVLSSITLSDHMPTITEILVG